MLGAVLFLPEILLWLNRTDPQPAPTPVPKQADDPIEWAPLWNAAGLGVAVLIGLIIIIAVGLIVARMVRQRRENGRALREAEQSRHVRRAAALAAIDRVKDQYGTRLTDIGYVIENHALFDVSFAETAAFTDTYTHLLDIALDKLSVDDLEAKSAELTRTWNLARDRAEHLGLRALGDRPEARRAVKVARKAKAVEGTPEQAALLESLRVLLDTLGILIPQQTLNELEAVQRHALEPRPAADSKPSTSRPGVPNRRRRDEPTPADALNPLDDGGIS